MTAKQYKYISRIKVTKLTKFITWVLLLSFFAVAHVFSIGGYITAAIGTTIWLYMPDLVAYLLELRYHIKHDYISYR